MAKKLEIKLPARAGAWYVVSSALIKLAGMAATPLFTDRGVFFNEAALSQVYNQFSEQ